MDISTSSSTRPQTPTCAYPSWPRRSSLNECRDAEEATSYISDDDIFPCVFDDSETDCAPVITPSASRSVSPSYMMREVQVVDNRALMRELLAQQQQRQQQQQQQQQTKKERRRRSSGSSRKLRSANKPMSPIQEVGE